MKITPVILITNTNSKKLTEYIYILYGAPHSPSDSSLSCSALPSALPSALSSPRRCGHSGAIWPCSPHRKHRHSPTPTQPLRLGNPERRRPAPLPSPSSSRALLVSLMSARARPCMSVTPRAGHRARRAAAPPCAPASPAASQRSRAHP